MKIKFIGNKGIVLLIYLFITLFLHQHSVYAETNKNILVIHSYHQGLKWTKDENDGITSVLDKYSNNVNEDVEYLDWKNYPDEGNLKHLAEYFSYKYRNKKIDCIITSDDTALKFAIDNRKKLFNNAPIVFCGVNNESYTNNFKNINNITGVIEGLQPLKTFEIAKRLNPNINKVYCIFENTESGLSNGKYAINSLDKAELNLSIVSLNGKPEDQIFNILSNADHNSIGLIVSYYSELKEYDRGYISFCRKIGEVSKIPVYHLYDWGIGNGEVGGAIISGHLQGENAAKYAFKILKGEKIEKLPVINDNIYKNEFDYKQLVKYGLSVDKASEMGTVYNKPISIFNIYKNFFIGAMVLYITLILLLIGLIINIIKNKRNSRKLFESEEKIKLQNVILKKEKAKYRELAFSDILTGLYNRQMLHDELDEKLMQHDNKFGIALFYIDIDNFKYINDTMGHAFGDEVLVKIGDELKKLLKYHGISIYRIGGDEFVLLLEDYKEEIFVRNYAKKILNHIKKTIEIDGRIFNLSASIGISLFPTDGENTMELLRNADTAMYKVKGNGKNGFRFYDKEYYNEIVDEIKMNEDLLNAVNKNEFVLYYQPQWDTKSRKISGIEALIRWMKPDGSFIPPDKFISEAEKTGLIIQIGEWVLKTACSFASDLHKNGYEDMQLSVNVSMIQIMHENFVDMVKRILKETNFSKEKLTLEITESVLIEDFHDNISKLYKLKDFGVEIALDDFGKGYSSLSYLKKLPISVLKIDKTFIDDIREYNNSYFIDSIIAIGHKMNMSIVAEGVETERQLNYLMNYNCDKIQGFYISRPLPDQTLISLLKEEKNKT